MVYSAQCSPASRQQHSSHDRIISPQNSSIGLPSHDSSNQSPVDLTRSSCPEGGAVLDLTGSDANQIVADAQPAIDLTSSQDAGEAEPAVNSDLLMNLSDQGQHTYGASGGWRDVCQSAADRLPAGTDPQGGWWRCHRCTFVNEVQEEVCAICLTPEDGVHHRRQQIRRPRARNENDGTWACPLCTYQNSFHYRPLVCRACESGRPQADDLVAAGLVNSGASQGNASADYIRVLESMLQGALVGGGVGAAVSAVRGEMGGDNRRRALQGVVAGGVLGGATGALREMWQLDQLIERGRLSYEDMLNLFGPGHEVEPADQRTVRALPEARLSKVDIQRMEEGSSAEERQCAICQEEYSQYQVLKRLLCGHAFHKHCVQTWLLKHSKFCPICRLPVLVESPARRDTPCRGT